MTLAGPRHEAVVVAVVAGIVYATTACPYVVGGDNGEFATLAAAGGVAHPSGYPLYVLWLRAFAWLPARSPAHASALATAILGAGAVWMLGRACAAWGASRASTAIVAAVFAFSPIAWDLATHAEVFALNTLLAMVVVALAAPASVAAAKGEARVATLGLAAGLGLSNHLSIVLLAPLGIFAAVSAARRARRPPVAVLAGIVALGVGLLPYAYLVYVARTTTPDRGLVWGEPSTPGALLRHFLRADYGTTQLSASDAPALPFTNLASLAKDVVVGLSGVPIFALAGGALAARRAGRPRAPLVALAAAFVLAGPVFVARFNLGTGGVHPAIAARFHLLPTALGAVLSALGLDALLRARDTLARWRGAGAAAAALLGATRAALSWADVAEGQRPTIEQYMENVLRSAPRDAIVLGASDAVVGAYFYETIALGKRPDVVLVAPPLMLGEWYPRRVSAQLGFEVVRATTPPGAKRPVLETAPLLMQLLRSGRPLLAADWFPRELAESAPSYPVGPLVRLVLDPRTIPDPYTLEEGNRALFATFALEPEPPRAGSWAALPWTTYGRAWASLAGAFDGLGDADHAAACRARAARFAPRP